MLIDTALLHLLQLVSPALPVGAYSYSEGLEALVAAGAVSDATSLQHWLEQELFYGTIRLDASVIVRTHRAVLLNDNAAVYFWNDWLSAVRDTEELRHQSWQMGRSLLSLLQALEPAPATVRVAPALEPCNFAIAFALAAADWQIDPPTAVLGYLQSWATNLIGAGVKLIPLGQTTGQQLLAKLAPSLLQATQESLTLEKDNLNACGWGLSLASMAHEVQYTRLFRAEELEFGR